MAAKAAAAEEDAKKKKEAEEAAKKKEEEEAAKNKAEEAKKANGEEKKDAESVKKDEGKGKKNKEGKSKSDAKLGKKNKGKEKANTFSHGDRPNDPAAADDASISDISMQDVRSFLFPLSPSASVFNFPFLEKKNMVYIRTHRERERNRRLMIGTVCGWVGGHTV